MSLSRPLSVRRFLALSWTAAMLFIGACSRPEPWNVVIVTFDTTRADALACYGNPEASTPNLDRLAEGGVLFENAFAAVPITLPSHTTLMTGTYPLAHGIRDNGLFILEEERLTLAEILSENGYRTAAAVGAYPLGSFFNLDQGFELYDDHFMAPFEDFRGRRVLPKADIFFDERRAAQVNESAFPWLEKNHEEPFFLWLHYFDAHQPLQPLPPWDQLFIKNPYLGEIAYADEAFGQVLKKLDQLGVSDRTLVVFTADHGEGRGDHGEDTHSMLAFNSTLRVPLIIKVPGGKENLTITERVGLVDVVSTLLDLLEIEAPQGLQGRSLVPMLEGESATPTPYYAETLSPRLSHGFGELRVLFDGDHKLIFGPRPKLYNLAQDPKELENLGETEPELLDRMTRKLGAMMKKESADEVQQLGSVDDEIRDRLEALGYIGSRSAPQEPIREVLRPDGIPPEDRVGDVNLMSMAKQLLANKKSLQAKLAVEEMIRRHPGDPMALEMMTTVQLQLGQVDGALEALNRLRELYPEGTPLSGRLMMQLGGIHMMRGEYSEALEILTDSQRVKPSAEGQYLMAMAYRNMGEFEKEGTPLEAALEIDPTHGPARVAMAVHYTRSGEKEAADREFRRALADQPYFPRAHFNYGAFLVENGDLEGSTAFFERALVIEPRYLQPYYALVAVHIDLGLVEKAGEWLVRLQEIAPESSEAEQAVRLLEDS